MQKIYETGVNSFNKLRFVDQGDYLQDVLLFSVLLTKLFRVKMKNPQQVQGG